MLIIYAAIIFIECLLTAIAGIIYPHANAPRHAGFLVTGARSFYQFLLENARFQFEIWDFQPTPAHFIVILSRSQAHHALGKKGGQPKPSPNLQLFGSSLIQFLRLIKRPALEFQKSIIEINDLSRVFILSHICRRSNDIREKYQLQKAGCLVVYRLQYEKLFVVTKIRLFHFSNLSKSRFLALPEYSPTLGVYGRFISDGSNDFAGQGVYFARGPYYSSFVRRGAA